MKLCTLFRCELEVEPNSEYCFRHQNLGRGEQHDPFDPELARLRRKIERVEAMVRITGGDEFSGIGLAEAIREVLDAP